MSEKTKTKPMVEKIEINYGEGMIATVCWSGTKGEYVLDIPYGISVEDLVRLVHEVCRVTGYKVCAADG